MFSDRNRTRPKGVKIALITVGFLLLAVVLGFWIQFLWNSTIAAIFELPDISYWQAVGLFVLAKFLFGMFPSHRHGRYRHRKNHSWKGGVDSEEDADSEEGSEPTDNATFKKYWREEGKEAYEAFRAARKKGSGK